MRWMSPPDGAGSYAGACAALTAVLTVFLLTACTFSLPSVAQTPIAPPAGAPSATPAPTASPTPTVTPTPAPDPYSPAGFDALLAQLEPMLFAERGRIVNAYWAQLPQTPLVDSERAVFLWRGEAQSIAVIGDMNGWRPTEAWLLSRIPGTELWWLSADLPAAARLDYLILRNADGAVPDPANERRALSARGQVSELVMPAYTSPVDTSLPSTIPRGTVTQHAIDSEILGTERTFFVYTPPGQIIGAQTPSIYFHDGTDYLNFAEAPELLDQLIAARIIPPVVAVFVPPIDRLIEYDRNATYAAFIVDEIVPFVRRAYDTDPAAARTATAGTSLGGLFAVYLGLSQPDVFGLVAGQSGAYHRDNYAIIQEIAGREPQPVRFHLSAGTFETDVAGDVPGDYLAASQRLAGVLESFGYPVTYVEQPQGHSWGFWRGYLGVALADLFEAAP